MSRSARWLATVSAISRPSVGEVVAGQAAVEDPVRVVHLAVAQQVDDGALRLGGASDTDLGGRRHAPTVANHVWVLRHASRARPGGGPRRGRQGRDDPVDGRVVVRRRRRTTPRTRTAAGRPRARASRGRRPRNAAVVLGLRVVVRAHRRRRGRRPRTSPPAHCTVCRHAVGRQRRSRRVGDRRGRPGPGARRRRRCRPQRRQPGRGGDRVPGQRARLVDRPVRREQRHARRRGRRRPRPGSRRPSPCRRSSGRAGPRHTGPRGRTSRRREHRNPVITSSEMSSAPCSRGDPAQPLGEARQPAARRPCCRRPPR